MKKVGVIFAIVASSLAAGTGYHYWKSHDDITFHPKDGEQRLYRIATSVGRGKGFSGDLILMDTLQKYQVKKNDSEINIKVNPVFLQVSPSYDSVYTSATNDSNRVQHQLQKMMTQGYRFHYDLESGKIDLELDDKSLSEKLEISEADLAKQMNGSTFGPGFMSQLPVNMGDHIVVDETSGLPALRLTVVDEDDQYVTYSLQRDNEKVFENHFKTKYSEITIGVDDIQGTLSVERDSGWIHSLALVMHQSVSKDDDEAESVKASLRIAEATHPSTGSQYDSFPQFGTASLFPRLDFNREDDDDLDDLTSVIKMSKSMSQEEKKQFSSFEASQTPYREPNTYFSYDSLDNRLSLFLSISGEASGINYNKLSLDDIDLIDKTGKAIDTPLVLSAIQANEDGRRGDYEIILYPLEDDGTLLESIDSINAEFSYQQFNGPDGYDLPLTDKVTSLEAQGATVRAIPDDTGWILMSLANGVNNFTLDIAGDYQDVMDHRAKTYQGLNASELGLLERVENPDARVTLTRIEGKQDSLPMSFYRGSTPIKKALTFKSRRAHDRNIELSPTHYRRIPADNVPEGKEIHLEKIKPTGKDENQLMLKLPIGIMVACDLAVSPDEFRGHKLVWRISYGDNEYTPEKGYMNYRLITDDDEKYYFYDIDISTTLTCPGVPHWTTQEIEAEKSMPWLVNVHDSLDMKINRDMPAREFFEQVFFLDRDGHPLQPMLLDTHDGAEYDDPVWNQGPSWEQEVMSRPLGDYMDDQSRIRFMGSVKSLKRITFTGNPIVREWHDDLKGVL